jgi:hypothetical protein
MWPEAIIFIAVASIGGLVALGIGSVDAESSRTAWIVMLASSLALIAGIAGIVRAVSRFIKCPNCGRVPTDEGAVDLFAKRRPHCDAKLA